MSEKVIFFDRVHTILTNREAAHPPTLAICNGGVV